MSNSPAAAQAAADNRQFWLGVAKLPEPAQKSFWDGGALLSQYIGENPNSLAALHDPDMIAGGADQIRRLGDRKVNSSLGSQWAKEDRVAEMDRAAEDALKKHGPDAKMNVTLDRCE